MFTSHLKASLNKICCHSPQSYFVFGKINSITWLLQRIPHKAGTDSVLLKWHFYTTLIASNLHISFNKPHTLIWKSSPCPWAFQRGRKEAFRSCLSVYTTHHISLNSKAKPPWRIGLCKEAKLISLKHLMQQKQLVVGFRLWWRIIAEMPEAGGVKIYWEANTSAFIWEGDKRLSYTKAPLASTLRQRKYLLQCVSQLITAWWPRFERSHGFTFQW